MNNKCVLDDESSLQFIKLDNVKNLGNCNDPLKILT
jgi:hypothetical protein